MPASRTKDMSFGITFLLPRTLSIAVTSPSLTERMGFIFRISPMFATVGLILPPFFRYFRVVTTKKLAEFSASSFTAFNISSLLAPSDASLPASTASLPYIYAREPETIVISAFGYSSRSIFFARFALLKVPLASCASVKQMIVSYPSSSALRNAASNSGTRICDVVGISAIFGRSS